MNSAPPILSLIAVMASAAIVGGFVAYFLAMLWRRGWDAATPLLLGEMLYRQGHAVACAALAPGAHNFAIAVRRCVGCQEVARCRTWLDSGERDGYQAFCPNAGYVTLMKQIAA
jgi:hypothetical protein